MPYAASPRKLFILFLRFRREWVEHGTSDSYKGMLELIEKVREETPKSFRGDLEYHVAEYKLVNSFEPIRI